MKNYSIEQGEGYSHYYKQLEQLEQFENISFDFFDTLVFRTTDSHFQGWKKKSKFFAFNRAAAEVMARIISRIQGKKEIRSDEIYRFMFWWWSFRDEIDLESANLRPNYHLRDLIDELLEKGKNVFIVSDTHFSPAQVTHWLKSFNFASLQVHTSQEHYKTKATGLFAELVSLKGISPDTWAHVGDNIISDVYAPREVGISGFHFPSLLMQLEKLGIISSKGSRYLLSKKDEGIDLLEKLRLQISKSKGGPRLFDMTLQQSLGYLVVAPVAECIAKSVHLISIKSKTSSIFYSSRDGWIPFLFHKKNYPLDQAHYFKTSRAMLKDPRFVDYVQKEVRNNSSICLYDLGWRGSTLTHLQRNLPDIAWIGCYGFFRGKQKSTIYEILGGDLSQNTAIWRSRDFIEILFPDPSLGYIALDSNNLPIEKSHGSSTAFSKDLIEGVENALSDKIIELEIEQAKLLLYICARYPSDSLIESLSSIHHDIDGIQFSPLVTNSWRRLLSKDPVMWPYSAALKGKASPLEKLLFQILFTFKEVVQRVKNLVGRLLFR